VEGHVRAYLAANGVSAHLADHARRAEVVLRRTRPYDARLGDEGYELRVRGDGVTLTANTERGLFYALQTLQQITARSGGRLSSREATVVDRPEYRWRGVHLDVARHFFPVGTVERYIGVAAHYKLNVFHWHLTDDQAWRLPSDRYPALRAREGYSSGDVREVIAYAARLYVTVVPEIDMPAHAAAAVQAFPYLGCGPATLCPTGPGRAFARNVLGDTIALFPSPYVHAGGDEVFGPVRSAQPRFTGDLARYAESRGRRLIVWDDAFTPRLPRSTTVTVWTGRARAAQIARHGNDVVFASAPLYFDAAQGDPAQEPPASRHMSTLERVYDSTVTPPGLTRREAAHVLGAQANLWTEHVATDDRLFSMLLPRALALAEIAWTPRGRKSWTSFVERLPAQFAWLEAQRYPFRIPNVSFTVGGGRAAFEAVPGHVQSVRVSTTASAVTVALAVPLDGAVIRATSDGSDPSPSSPAYHGPFTVAAGRAPVRVRAAAFLHGRRGAVTEALIARVSAAALRGLSHASLSWASLVSP
ncbi:MAG TPA: family 20 glycosylhydrolase, partial [Candidatus Elarobacter sp.]|nr:family 20 glycosylhydrolase [Candidatus Elarobacter sp.]